MDSVVIVNGARTPIGKFGGSFKSLATSDLGASAIKGALERSGVDPSQVEETIMGTSIQVMESGYSARLSSLKAGIPAEVPALAVNRQCSSGLEAINTAAQLILTGEIEIAVAGGTETMSAAPYVLPKARWDPLRMGDATLQDSLLETLNCPVNHYHMGITAENVASQFEISRSDQDELALMSHQRAVKAMGNGSFEEQIVPVSIPQRKGDPIVISEDESPRADTSLEKLSALPPFFKKDGSVTAGNSSALNDGAAAVVMMSGSKAKSLGLKPRLEWVSRGAAGVDPSIMGTGPVPAVQKVIKKANLELSDIDVIELNEAFASQALYCMRELSLDIDKTNVCGSGISLGHPVGATGAIMTVKLMEELQREDKELGLVTMCIGGGQGLASIFKRIN